jgi:hypothetical protein
MATSNRGSGWGPVKVEALGEVMNVTKDNGGKVTNLTVTRLAIFLAKVQLESEARIAAAYRAGIEDGSSSKTSALKSGAL